MEKKNGINFFLAFIIIILGWTLFKHIDFKNFTLKDPLLDILYAIVLIIAIFFLLKDRRRPVK